MKKAPNGAYSVGGGGSGIQWVTPSKVHPDKHVKSLYFL